MSKYKYLSHWAPGNDAKSILQVVTCFLHKKNRFLILQRARKDAQHDLWGIPGGKLDTGESPLQGLSREIMEETQIPMPPDMFTLLGTARSQTPSDGEYGLYLYHAPVFEECSIQINPQEHYAFRWVTMGEFETLPLLTAQKDAYLFVKKKLQNIMYEKWKLA